MPPTLETNFSAVDWVLVALYLLATVVVGIVVNRYVRNMSDYVVAGRGLKSALGVATLIGSELGLVTVMYAAEKGVTGGFAAFHIGLVAGVTTLIIGATGFIVVPLRAQGIMTIPEYYERRFGRRVRIYGGILLAVAGILNMGMFLKAGAIFVTGLTGMQDPLAVKLVMTLLIVLVLVYTILGGMVSVIITDYLQFVVLSVGLLLACGIAFYELGWSQLVEGVEAIHGEAGFDPLSESGFGASYVLWQIFTAGIVSCAVWQTAVLRACSAESVETVKRLYAWSSIGFMTRFLLPQFLGICGLVYFWQQPETRAWLFPDGGGLVTDPETTLQVMPLFLSQILPVGVIGVIAAGLLAAFMSTHDSYLLCWSSVLTEDVVNPLTGNRLSMRARLLLTRCLICVIGVFLLVWSLWYPLGQGLWDYMAITGAIYATGAFAVLLLGIYWKGASRAGAWAALTCGAFALVGLDPVKNALGLGEAIRSDQVGLLTAAGAVVLMFVFSKLFPDRIQEEAGGS